MKNHIFVICLIITAFVSSCLYAQSDIKISIQEVLSIGGENSEEIYQCAALCTDSQENIYLTDMMDYSIKKFSRNGELISKTGRKGGGPGEFNAIRLIAYYQDKVYVTDQYKPGIQVFTKDLSYIKTISFNKPIADICPVSENLIAVEGVVLSGEGYIDIIDHTGDVKKSLMYDHGEKSLPVAVIARFSIDKHGDVYIASLFKDKFIKIDSTGSVVWKKTMYGKKQSKVTQANGIGLPEDTFNKFVEIDTCGNIFVLGGGMAKHPGRDVYVFDNQGNMLTTLCLEHETHFIHIDKENNLYSRAMLSTKIIKYKLIYKQGFAG